MVGEGYKQTEIGVIPEDWGVQTIGESFEIKNNLRLPISKKVREKMEGPYPYYGPTGVQGNINEYKVEGEHALVGEDGDHFLKWRNVPMTLLVNGKFNVNNHAHIIKGEKNLTSWFFWFFAHRDITSYLTRQGAGRFKLNKSSLISIPCAIPGLHEQKNIAEALSDVDSLIDGLKKLIAKKRDIKTASMQQLLTGKTRLPGFSGEWKTCVLHDECDLITKGTTPTSIGKKFVDRGVSFVKIESVSKEGLVLPDKLAFIDKETHVLLKRSQLKAFDILFSIAGALGRTVIVPSGLLPANTNQALAIIRLKDSSTLDHRFLYLFLSSGDIKLHIQAINVQAAQANLSLDDIANFKIQLPQIKEQQAIATVLSDMDKEINSLQSRLTKTNSIKQGMMQELLTGKTRLL